MPGSYQEMKMRIPAKFGIRHAQLATARTFFGNTANLAPRQGLLVARITF